MVGVGLPIDLDAYYPGIAGPTEPPYDAAVPITATTPYVHDITIANVTATGATARALLWACRNPACATSCSAA